MERLKVTIREAREEDRSFLYLLAEETLHPQAEQAGRPERYDERALLALLERARVYVGETETAEIAGFIAFEDEDDGLELRCLCVAPAYEARAVGRQLLAWVEGLAFAEGRSRLSAFVPADDRPSRHLYEGHDFLPQPAAGRPEMIVLEKRLPAR
jgi:ribosomal protein S18 acetylase RimI-like enzyme